MSRRRPSEGVASDKGASVVELAMVLPLIVMLMLAIIQVGFVAADFLMVHHVAREAGRAAALEPDLTSVAKAAKASADVDGDRLRVELRGERDRGGLITVRVSYLSPTNVVVVGRLIGDAEMAAEVTMRVE